MSLIRLRDLPAASEGSEAEVVLEEAPVVPTAGLGVSQGDHVPVYRPAYLDFLSAFL